MRGDLPRPVRPGLPALRGDRPTARPRPTPIEREANTSIASARVEAKSDIAAVEAGIPPDYTAAIDDLNAAKLDLDARVTALETP